MGALDQLRMGLLSRGCPYCKGDALEFHTYLDGEIRVMLGDPAGDWRWLYDGEKFIDGVFKCQCAKCKRELFNSDMCPRCNAEGALESVLEEESALEPPDRCPECDDMDILLTAFVPARVLYVDKKAGTPKVDVDIDDPGFRGVSWRCEICEHTESLEGDGCPLCGADGPLRERP